MNKYNTIICFGEILWDMLPGGAKPGGAPLNVAIHLKKQKQNPLLISKVGNDTIGYKLIDFLNKFELKTDLIQTDKKLPTSQVLIRLDKNKNATYEICEPVAWDNIKFNTQIENEVKKTDLFVFGTLASRKETTLKTLLRIIDNTNATKLLDVNLRPPYNDKTLVEKLLHLSDFAKLNNDELSEIATWNNVTGSEEELILWFSGFFKCPIVCITRGEKGAVLLLENKLFSHSGFKIKTADTVGAGDSFLASLVANLSKNISPEKALEHACATGAFVASKEGAVPNYSEKEIIKIIKTST